MASSPDRSPASSPTRGGASSPSRAPAPPDYSEIQVYMRDVVRLLLQVRDERPLEFIAEYFNSVLDGTHVLMREYAYINACARNRRDFVKAAREAFAGLKQQERLDAAEMTQLLQLLCVDFPQALVAHACLLCGSDERQPLSKLLHATLVSFFFAEFLERTAEVFCTCDTRDVGQVNRNVLCLTLRQMMNTKNWRFSCPSASIFDEVLQAAPHSSQGVDVKLLQMQKELLVAPAMYEAILTGGDPPGRDDAAAAAAAASMPRSPAQRPAERGATINRMLDEMRGLDVSVGSGARRRSEHKQGKEKLKGKKAATPPPGLSARTS